MTRKMRCIVTVWLLACLTVVSAVAQDYKTLIGKWNMTSETNGDPVKWPLELKETDGKLMGVLGAGEGAQPAKDLTYANGVIKFKAPYQGEYYDIELKMNGEKLDGTWSGNGDSGKTSGTKVMTARGA